ncbi:MAG TPA: APC family permease [Legionella sp.]|nr:APC family permease [Legionella sp.]
MKRLSVLNLTLITVCSVDSIRNLPAAALAGNQLVSYFILALLFFLLPCAIISIWFSRQSDQGIYGWVKKGLGINSAFAAVCFQCFQNVLIYPTLLSFIAGTLLYTLSPELSENKLYLFALIITLIWGLTWVNLKGIRLSSNFNAFCSITGLLIPFAIILIMGFYWWLTQTNGEENLLPPATPYSWTSLTAIILSFCGIELAAVHAEESQPGAFPKAIYSSVLIIFLSMLFGALILAMIIPANKLNFINSIPQLVQLFCTKMNCNNLAFIINGLIAIGCIGAANNWLIAPIKGLGFAARDGLMDQRLSSLNKNNAPGTLLILQATCVSFISTLFLIIPSINSSYWIMLNAATQINLLMYLLFFISAIRILTYRRQMNKTRILIPSCFGLIGTVVTLIVSLQLPNTLHFKSQITYALFGCSFLVSICFFPLWIQRKRKNQTAL